MNTLLAIFCVLLFSLTVPFTRVAALETMPESIILLRLIGAGIMCLILIFRDRWLPSKAHLPGLMATAAGSVIGFSSFTAYAMKVVPSGHGSVALAALPIFTAAYSTIRDKFNPGMRFWFFALLGTLISFSYFYVNIVNHVSGGDLYLLLAILSAAFGYVEGGRMSRKIGGYRTMSWAILLTLPFTVSYLIWFWDQTSLSVSGISTGAWLSMGYLALVSQSGGMFLWFSVLAKGKMEKIALIQLVQPFLSLLASIIFLNELVEPKTWIVAVLVASCVFGANRAKAQK